MYGFLIGALIRVDRFDSLLTVPFDDVSVSIGCLRRTVEILIEKGRFRQAADRQKDIARIFQQDSGDLQGALDAFLQAGEWYAQEDAHAYVPCRLLNHLYLSPSLLQLDIDSSLHL